MRALLRLLGLVTLVGLTVAQNASTAPAHCIQGQFTWMFNSLNQDPCTVGQNVGQVCGTGYEIPPLATDEDYLGPVPAAANSCRCSSVLYSLLSACALCQDAQTMPWNQYNQNCSAVYVSVFPGQIPTGVTVPHWAYMNVTIYDGFNVTYAQQLIGPESTAIPQPTATSSATSTSSTSTSTTSSSHKPSIIAPVVGGVVGGVVFLALLSVAAMLLLRRRHLTPMDPAAGTWDPRMSLQEGKDGMVYPPYPVPIPPPEQSPLLYDPSDPRTYPPTPSPLWSEFTSTRTESVQPTITGSNFSSGPTRYYTGAPEL